MSNTDVEILNKKKTDKKQTLLERFDIPIEHLSYEYIGECSNAKELERIVRILRSGEEGVYLQLTKFAEDRLTVIKPESSILRVPQPIVLKSSLRLKERQQLDAEIGDWFQEMKLRERDIVEERSLITEREPLSKPTVRRFENNYENNNKVLKGPQRNKEKKLSSSDYAVWDKYDVDTELMRIDLVEEKERAEAKRLQELRNAERTRTKNEVIIEKSLLSGTELSVLSCREREKGNEAYRAGDYEEALQLYSASAAFDYNIAVYNNRAMTYIKLKKFENAAEDCSTVLNTDPENVKALLRRGLAYKNLGKNIQALEDYNSVLKVDPSNSIAINAINKLIHLNENIKPVRLTIEEIYDDD